MTLLIYLCCIRIYCELVGTMNDYNTLFWIGIIAWVIHLAVWIWRDRSGR